MPGTISFRLAAQADLEQIIARQTLRESPYPGPDLIRRWVRSKCFWVAMTESKFTGPEVGRLVGWMSLEYTFFEEGFVGTLWVEDDFRRQGIGTSLVRKGREICKTERLWTSTNESNKPMQRLLEAVGWEHSGTIRHLDPGDPEMIYCHLATD